MPKPRRFSRPLRRRAAPTGSVLRRAALFLDRDGVVNIDHGYTHRIGQFQFVDGVFDMCRLAKRAGSPVVIVTNQAGIARGYYTEEDFYELTRWMCARFDAEGAPLTDVLFDPTHPTAGLGAYRRESDDRKPNPGMFLKAAARHDIDLTRSVMVGDTDSDMIAALRAGVPVRIRIAAVGAPIGAATLRASNVREAIDLVRPVLPSAS